MIRMTKEIRLSVEDVLTQASRFFGKGGVGLEEKDRTGCCIFFEGAGGYVSVTLVEKEKNRIVDIESREWEYQVNRFLETL